MGRLLNQTLNKSLKENGYLQVKGQLNHSLIDRLRRKAIICAAQIKIGLKENSKSKLVLKNTKVKLTSKEVAKFALKLVKSKEYLDLKKSKELKNAIKDVFGDNWKFYKKNNSFFARMTVPNRIFKPMKPHQDSIYLGVDKKLYVIWIPLHDCPLNLGGIAVIPKSHRHGLYDHQNLRGLPIPMNDKNWKRFKFKKGDFLIFHYNIIHGPSVNKTKNISRISVDMRLDLEKE